MLSFLRSPGRCYIAATAALALGVGVIFMQPPGGLILLSLPCILASVALLIVGAVQEMRDRYRAARRSSATVSRSIEAMAAKIRADRAAKQAKAAQRDRKETG